MTVEREAWMESAACRGMGTSNFILENGTPSTIGKSTCAVCPHRGIDGECFSYAVRTGSVGIWGGVVIDIAVSERKLSRMRGTIQDGRAKSVPQKSGAGKRRQAVYPSTVAARAGQ